MNCPLEFSIGMKGAFERLCHSPLSCPESFHHRCLQSTRRRCAALPALKLLLDANLAFHLELCGLSENAYLIECAYKLLLPFFAFVRIRAIASDQSTSLWAKDFGAINALSNW